MDNEFFETMLENSEKEAESLSDKGHIALSNDIQKLIVDVERGLYHDFHRNGADAPKIKLVSDLESIINNVKSGKYDN